MEKQPSAKKILVVDDNPVVLKALRFKLEMKRMVVVTAADATEAFGAMRQHRFDLVLVDMGFPPDIVIGGDTSLEGFSIIEWMRRNDVAKNIPIIIITGSEPEIFRERAEALGVVAIFKKPVNYLEMFEKITKLFGGMRSEITLHA